MTDSELAAHLGAVLSTAQAEHRRSLTGFGALVTPPIPDALLARVAVGLVPVLRDLVDAAVAERVAS